MAQAISIGGGAEASCPGTAREFVTQVPNHFVLRSLRKRKEGGNSGQTHSTDSLPSKNSASKLTVKLPPREAPDVRPEQELPDKESDLEPRPPPKTYHFTRTRQIFSSLTNRISHILCSIPCVSSNHFYSESVTTSISSTSSIIPTPRIDKYPVVNNRGVYQSAPFEFTLKHPKDHSGATASMAIQFPSIFEIFDHHDAVLELTHVSVQLKPEPLSWDEFTKIWNAHATENNPRFVTWDSELGLYINPLIIVSLDDLNLTPRSPKVLSDASTLTRVISNVSAKSNVSSATTTTTTDTSCSTSTLNLPAKLLEDLFAIARSIRKILSVWPIWLV